jgi:translation elongation factor EF-G
MSKKQLANDAKTVGKLTKKAFSALNMNVPIKEKTDNFFKELENFLENGETEEAVEDKFNNHPQTLKKNLEFLMKRFTNNPTKNQLENIKESAKVMLELLDKKLQEEIKKKKKETS